MSQYEDQARGLGWKPKEEWEGPEEEWVTARSFVEKGDMIGQIRASNRRSQKQQQEMENLRKAVGDLKTLQENTAKFEYERAKRDLLQAKEVAYAEGDHAKVVQVDEKIREIDNEAAKYEKTDTQVDPQQMAPPENQNPNHPAYVSWYESNKEWYEGDMIKSALWDKLANLTMAHDPNIDPYEFIDTTTKAFNKELGKMAYQAPKSKVGGTPPGGENEAKSNKRDKGDGKPKHRFSDLPEDLQEVARNFVNTGAFENYDAIISEWEKIGTI